jgi:hypothetical protein
VLAIGLVFLILPAHDVKVAQAATRILVLPTRRAHLLAKVRVLMVLPVNLAKTVNLLEMF